MAGDHSHGLGRDAVHAGARYKQRLVWAFALISGFFAVEVAAGLATNSLALLSDAGHMLADVIGLGMALAAIGVAGRARPSAQRSFGLYRLEILAALANAVLLFGVAAFVLYEAVRRLGDPPEVLSTPMLVVAVLGLAVNLVALALLRSGAAHSMNVQGAYLEVVADTLGSVGVILAGAVVAFTGWLHADPLVAAAIGIFVLPRTYRLGRRALRILVQAAPAHVSVDDVRRDLSALDGVHDVHDVHVWTLTSAMDVASAHLTIGGAEQLHSVLDRAQALLRDRYGIDHATLQVEPDTHEGCKELSW